MVQNNSSRIFSSPLHCPSKEDLQQYEKNLSVNLYYNLQLDRLVVGKSFWFVGSLLDKFCRELGRGLRGMSHQPRLHELLATKGK